MKNASTTRPLPTAAEGDAGTGAVERCGSRAVGLRASRADGGLWAQTTPEAMAAKARDLFGADAAEAIAWCALSARRAHREADLRFWRGVLVRLEALPEGWNEAP